MARRNASSGGNRQKTQTPGGCAAGSVFLRHLQPEEALSKLDVYINQAFLQGLTRVKVVHGKGAGILRRLVRTEMLKHPLVKSVSVAAPEEGGEGVTILELESLK